MLQRREYIVQSRGSEEQRPYPFPTPGNDEHYYNESCWNEVHQQSNDCLPGPIAFTKYIQGKHANEYRIENAENPRRPEQNSFNRAFHNDHPRSKRPFPNPQLNVSFTCERGRCFSGLARRLPRKRRDKSARRVQAELGKDHS